MQLCGVYDGLVVVRGGCDDGDGDGEDVNAVRIGARRGE